MCETSSRYIDNGAAEGCGREENGESKGMRSTNGENESAMETEGERPEGRSRTNNGIVTRLWMEASMKPMVCKTPCENGDAGQKGDRESTLRDSPRG